MCRNVLISEVPCCLTEHSCCRGLTWWCSVFVRRPEVVWALLGLLRVCCGVGNPVVAVLVSGTRGSCSIFYILLYPSLLAVVISVLPPPLHPWSFCGRCLPVCYPFVSCTLLYLSYSCLFPCVLRPCCKPILQNFIRFVLSPG